MDTSDAAMPDDVAGGGHESNPDAVALETRNSLLYLASHSATMSTLSAACLFGWGLGLAGFIGFESLAIWSAQRLVSRPVRLRVTEEGVHDDTGWYSPGFIAWSEVANVRITNLGFIEIDLVDEDAFLSRLAPLSRIRRMQWRFFGFGPQLIAPWGLAASRSEIFEALEGGLDEYTLRAVRRDAQLGPPE